MLRRRQNGRTWRAVVAGLAAYALALNAIFASGLASQIAVARDAASGFETCLSHNGALDEQSPALPDAGKLHCVLCVASTGAPLLPANAVFTAALGQSSFLSAERADNPNPRIAPRDPGKPPTGPPHTA